MAKDLTQKKLTKKERETLRWVSQIESKIEWGVSKYPFERQWMINLSFYMGQQDIRWDKTMNRPIANKSMEHRSKFTANKMVPAVEKAVSLLTQARPRWTAMPTTSSAEDVQASRFGVQLLEHYWDNLKMERKVGEMVEWACICGTAFLYSTTKSDPRTQSRLYMHPSNGQPIPGAMLTDTMRRTLEGTGSYMDYYSTEPDVQVLSPFRVAFDPDAASVEDARYMIHLISMPVDEVYEKFGVIVPEEEMPEGLVDFEGRLKSFFGAYGAGAAAGGGSGSAGTSGGKRTVVKQIVCKPYVERTQSGKNKEYPNGRNIIVAGGKPILDEENPYYTAGFENGFPVTSFSWHSVPGRIWGMGMVEQLIDPQKAYNDIRRREIDLFRLMGQPKWLSPYGANLKRGAINDRPGEIIEWNASAGPPPQPITMQPFAPAAVQLLQEASYRDFQDAAAQHDFLNSKMPNEMRSAPAMELAREGDLYNLVPKVRRLEECVGRVGDNLLKVAAKVIDENAYIEILGSNLGGEQAHFKAALLKGVHSVSVIRDSMSPTSAATQFQKALDLMQTGALNPQASEADKEVLMKASTFHEFDPELASIHQERRRAERETEMMFSSPDGEQFNIPRVETYDNDVLHLNVHYERVRTPEFERMPEPQREAILGHLYQHEERLRAAQEASFQRTMMMKGAPGQKGTPSPPKQSGQ